MNLFTVLILGFIGCSAAQAICKATMDVAFIVDSSGSVVRRNWSQLKQFLVNTISRLNVGPSRTHVAVVTYSTNATVEFDFTLKGNAITLANYKKFISDMPYYRGSTFIDKGLKLANEKIFTIKNGMRGANITKVALVITDGIQTKNQGSFTPLDQASARLQNKGVHVYALGIGSNIDVHELMDTGSDFFDYGFTASSFDDLKTFAPRFAAKACQKDGH